MRAHSPNLQGIRQYFGAVLSSSISLALFQSRPVRTFAFAGCDISVPTSCAEPAPWQVSDVESLGLPRVRQQNSSLHSQLEAPYPHSHYHLQITCTLILRSQKIKYYYAAQLLSREPRVFIRPNARGTLVAIEKAASHSVSLLTVIM